MRILFLMNYPLADNKLWKQSLIERLRPHHEVMVLFGKKSLYAHYRGYVRLKRGIDPIARYRQDAKAKAAPARRTVPWLRSAGVPVRTVGDVNDEAGRAVIAGFAPDYVVVTLDQILRPATLAAAPVFLNAHYGNLPGVRGWNASEWSLLTDRAVSVSLHQVTPVIDGGDIFMRRDVPAAGLGSLVELRDACQRTALSMYEDFFADPERYRAAPIPNPGGRNHYFMGRDFRALAQAVLARSAGAPVRS